ncbi:alpha/beta fold hydrolase [Pseudomarimonas arenosa]|uniref:Alpha/beta hydrolase n=1 Tax=Pseudomarimonas arenosa TaxID=2774145 RepID=A0AAW3ZN62_9GAMM|nr:alpha/beta hydrolase [Pseudomarimonas arenosa]MBD8526632.1 alpha/beta hydrolase [Pseudomarimonas arenosa]
MSHAQELRATGRVELTALRFNRGAGLKVLALHGWLDNAMSFAPLAAAWPEAEITALEFAGHGHSQHLPPGAWYHLIDYLDDISAGMTLMTEGCDLLLGHSLGGASATAFAAARPAQVPRMALIEALGPIAYAPEVATQALRTGLDERAALASKQLRLFESIEQAVAARLAANRMQPESARLLVERSLRVAGEGWCWASDPRLRVANPLRLSEAAIQNWIAAIECKVCLIAADHPPPYFTEATRQSRIACLRDSEQHILPGHHHLHMDDPQAVAAVLKQFV